MVDGGGRATPSPYPDHRACAVGQDLAADGNQVSEAVPGAVPSESEADAKARPHHGRGGPYHRAAGGANGQEMGRHCEKTKQPQRQPRQELVEQQQQPPEAAKVQRQQQQGVAEDS